MIQGRVISNDQSRQVRFIEMQENENGETRITFISPDTYKIRDVIRNVFGVPGCPVPYVLEDAIRIIERVIHHIGTYDTDFIDIYYQEVYTSMVAEEVTQSVARHIGEDVVVVFQENHVNTRIQMRHPVVRITEDLEIVWEFANEHFRMNHNETDILALEMRYERNRRSNGTSRPFLYINYRFIPEHETYEELFCTVCENHFDGRDQAACDNHLICMEDNTPNNQSDPDARIYEDDENENEDDENENEDDEDEETDTEDDEEYENENEENENVEYENENEENNTIINDNDNDNINIIDYNDQNNFYYNRLPEQNYTGHGLIGEPNVNLIPQSIM